MSGGKPIKEYFEKPRDWVLVKFVEKDTGWTLGTPIVCEYRKGVTFGDGWYPNCECEADWNWFAYYNKQCYAVAFLEFEDCPKAELVEFLKEAKGVSNG